MQGDRTYKDLRSVTPEAAIPADLFTADAWADTGKVTGTYSAGKWVESPSRAVGLRKPGRLVQDGLEAAREVIASHIGRWLQVDISVVELIDRHPDGPCCVSRAIAGSVIPYGQVIRLPFTSPTRKAAAIAALGRFSRAVVLDALVGNCDRFNDGNVVYAESEDRWYSIDYSLAFNRHHPAGVGDPALPYGAEIALNQRYFPEIVDAIRLSPNEIQRTVALAESISDAEIERLFAILPASHASPTDAGLMEAFVKQRRSQIRGILAAWTATVGLGGTI